MADLPHANRPEPGEELTVSFDLGPILRSITRQKSTFSLVVLELASGFMIIGCLLLASSWYMQRGEVSSGHHEADIVIVALREPAGEATAALDAAIDRDAQNLATLLAVPGVRGAVVMSSSLVDEHGPFPTEVRVAPLAGAASTSPSAYGYTIHTGPAVFDLLDLHVIEGTAPGRGLPTTAAAGELAGMVVLTRCFRDRLFPSGAPALGRTILSEESQPARVVAVIENVHFRTAFMPFSECAVLRFDRATDEREHNYLVRVEPGRRNQLIPVLAAALGGASRDRFLQVKAFDPKRTIYHSLATGLAAMFAVFCINVAALAGIGAVAVSSFLVAERRRSIGIRRALGATRADIIRYFLVESLLATALGTGLGVLGTMLLFLAMKNVFREMTFGWHYLVLTAVALWINATVAAMVPARRAAEIPPWVASRGL
jgi:putative ABC transport system permease protein